VGAVDLAHHACTYIYNLTHKFLIFFDYQWLEAAMVIESLFLMHYWRIADNDAAKRHLKA